MCIRDRGGDGACLDQLFQVGAEAGGEHEHDQTGAEAQIDDADIPRGVQLQPVSSFGPVSYTHLPRYLS